MEEEYVKNVYQQFASHFDETRVAFWDGVKLFLDTLPKYTVICDIGCGNGKYSHYRPQELCWIGTDLCNELLSLASPRLQHKSIDVFRADGTQLPFTSNCCQAAMSIAVLHHIRAHSSRLKFLNEMLRIVEPGGSILFTVWALEQPKKRAWVDNGNGDFMIPWNDRKTGNVFQRYYHLFSQSEMECLVSDLGPIVKTSTLTYERGNWFCTLHKI